MRLVGCTAKKLLPSNINLVENSRPVLKRCCPQRDAFPIATAPDCLAPGVLSVELSQRRKNKSP